MRADKEKTIDDAMVELGRKVRSAANGQDNSYFFQHEQRFTRTLRRLSELSHDNARVLDIGSHYLHLSSALSLLGYDVSAIDVAAFSDQELIKERAAKYNVDNHVVDRIDHGDFLPRYNETFDVIIFTEI